MARISVSFFVLGVAAISQGQQYVISTYAGGVPPATPVEALQLSISPQSTAADTSGNVYFVAHRCIFKLDRKGIVTRIAGTSRPGFSGDGGPATDAQLWLDSEPLLYYGPIPPPLAVGVDGNVYVADLGNYRVRRIAPDGVITTVAGNGSAGFSGDDGPAVNAQISSVFGLALDGQGNLFLADSHNHRIRMVNREGMITTIAGNGECGLSGDGGAAIRAQLCHPAGLAFDTGGNLFIADMQNNRIRRIPAGGIIETVAGSGPVTETRGADCGGAPISEGQPAIRALLCLPVGVAVNEERNLFVAERRTAFGGDIEWHVVRQISADGTITTVLGSDFECATWCFYSSFRSYFDGTTARKLLLGGPIGIAVGGGALLFTDPDRGRVSSLSSDGTVNTIAGDGQNGRAAHEGPAANARLTLPGSLAVDGAGNLLIVDYGNFHLRKVSREGIITTVAGTGAYGSDPDGGPATGTRMTPVSVAVDPARNLLVADYGCPCIRKVSPEGFVSTAVPASISGYPSSVLADRAGNLFISRGYAVLRLSPDGTVFTITSTPPSMPTEDGYTHGLAVDESGNLFLANDARVFKVALDGAIGTVAGTGTPGFSGDGGLATEAQLDARGIAVDTTGNVFIADAGNHRIRKIAPDGLITTIAGNGSPGYSGDDGPATSAQIWHPYGIAVDTDGNLYVSDYRSHAVRILRPAAVGAGQDGTKSTMAVGSGIAGSAR